MTCILNMIDEKRIIGARILEELYTWIDSAYEVYEDMRGQTRGAISMGYGLLHGKSSKQNINVKSSTEAEFVGVSEYLPYNIWFLMFMDAQGYDIKDNVVFHDNQSKTRMHINGRNSCTGNLRHIKVCYFLSRIDLIKGNYG